MQNKLQEAQNEKLLHQTIQPLPRRVFRFPLYFLRTWIFSLIALIALPVGIMLMLVSYDMETHLDDDWVQTEAIVDSRDEEGVVFAIDDFNIEGEVSFVPLDYIRYPQSGVMQATVGMCDLVAWVWIPQDENETFPIWVNPDSAKEYSCVPISRDMAVAYLGLGIILSVLSGIRLLRTFNQAATRRMVT